MSSAEVMGANLRAVRNLRITLQLAVHIHGSWIQPIIGPVVLYYVFIEKKICLEMDPHSLNLWCSRVNCISLLGTPGQKEY